MSYEKYTEEKIVKKYKTLPKVLKDFIVSEKLEIVLNEMVKKNGLLLDQAGILENEITLVILGEIRAEDFPKSLGGKINLGQEKLNELIKDVNEKVFKEIRASLREGATPKIKIVGQEVVHEPEELDRKQILEEIEQPEKKDFLSENIEDREVPHEKKPANLSDTKLTEATHLPKEEDKLKIIPRKTRPDPGEKKIDPYREQIE